MTATDYETGHVSDTFANPSIPIRGDILSCPHCGYAPSTVRNQNGWYAISCAHLGTETLDGPEEVVRRWNALAEGKQP